MSEDHLIRYCAPTLAGIKTGSLFGCDCQCPMTLRRTISGLNRRLVPKGLRVLPLRFAKNRALIYVYRPSGLRRDLSHLTARRILRENGYQPGSSENCIAQLVRRLHQQESFPHEIGLFLGYPPEDVEGFICNSAACSKCTGCWKVYGDVDAAQKRFDQYKKCSRIYENCWNRGTRLERLTVTR